MNLELIYLNLVLVFVTNLLKQLRASDSVLCECDAKATVK